jgi:hypothetical protein
MASHQTRSIRRLRRPFFDHSAPRNTGFPPSITTTATATPHSHSHAPSPAAVVCATASYVSVPERETTPIRPRWKMGVGMMPSEAPPTRTMPGEFGPSSRGPSAGQQSGYGKNQCSVRENQCSVGKRISISVGKISPFSWENQHSDGKISIRL